MRKIKSIDHAYNRRIDRAILISIGHAGRRSADDNDSFVKAGADRVHGNQIAEIRKTGIGLLLVEQSPKWIADCDRIYLIENGEVRMQGTAKEVLESEKVMRAYLGG